MSMSQQGSSVFNENPQTKYKKALVEIQKIHNANKILKNQSEEMKAQYESQINQLGLSLEHLQKENSAIKNEKTDLEKFLQDLQVSNTELRKQYSSLQREVSYLNEVLTEQNTELKKMNAFKDEKGLAALITSYQDRELSYRKDISRQEQIVKALKSSCEKLEADLSQQRRQRYKLEEMNSGLRMEISKYRELNISLLSKNQSIVANLLNRNSEGRQKYRQAEHILAEIGRQLQQVKHNRVQEQVLQKTTVSLDSYENLQQQKNKMEGQICRLREKLQESQDKSKEIFEMQENMKIAILRAGQLHEQCNMLKSKLVVAETKDIMEGYEGNEFEENIMISIAQKDPLDDVKNSSDSSHFHLMKGYVVELKEKLSKTLIQKKQYEKKYRSLKEKISEKAEKAIGLEEQNKLIRGKLEGFQRLAERLQFELQRNIESHEEEMSKMKQITNNILSKKGEETKTANYYMRAQLDLELEKFQRAEKSLRQEIDALKIELNTQKFKNSDLQGKLQQTSEFLGIYQSKFEQLQSDHAQQQETNTILSQNVHKFQQLYRDQRAKNEAFLAQKQAFAEKISQIRQESNKRFIEDNNSQERQAQYESEIRQLKAELMNAKKESAQLQSNFNIALKENEEKTKLNNFQMKQSGYQNSLQQNYQQEKQKNRALQSEIALLKVKIDRSNNQQQKTVTLEDALSEKSDELNDVKRKTIGLEKQLNILEAEMQEIRNEYEKLQKENASLKAKLLESTQQIRKNYQAKQADGKKQMQRMSEDLSSAASQLREEKRTTARLKVDVESLKNELHRYEDMVEQSKRKQSAVYQELSLLHSAYQSASEEGERLKSQLKFKTNMEQGLSSQIKATQEKVYRLNQQNSQIRIKMQSLDSEVKIFQEQYSELKRQLNGLKIYINDIEDFAANKTPNAGWQQLRDKENLSNFVQRFKRLIRTSQFSQGNTSEYRTFASNHTVPQIPDYLKSYVAQDYIRPVKIYGAISEESLPFSQEQQGGYKYRDNQQ